MMMLTRVLFILSIFFLTACVNHETDYLRKGESVPPLVVPKGVPIIKQDSHYPIPSVAAPMSTKPNSLVPPTMTNNT